MSEHIHSREQQPREGRWLDRTRLLGEEDLRSIHRGDGKSYEDLFTESYGPRSIGWDLIASDDPINTVAQEADEVVRQEAEQANRERQEQYVALGRTATGRSGAQSRVVRGTVGRIWIYPVGDEYYAENHGEEG